VSSLPSRLRLLSRDAETETDAEPSLVAQARRGDDKAFRAIYERQVGSVRRFLRDLLGDSAAADEATQETFVRAFLRIHTIREDEKLVPWLLGIARHVSKEHRRIFARAILGGLFREGLFRAAVQRENPVTESPETVVLRRESTDALTLALAQISEKRRAALLLRVDHGLSCAEVAKVMGWSIPKVKVELYRTRWQLRGLLARCGEEDR
jgi:RNA polymerase sigma-70 factor (ECF subfamily)